MKTNEEIVTGLISLYPTTANTRVRRQPKLNGGFRRIISPNPDLNAWLKFANKTLASLLPSWPSLMHGGIKKRSYVSFAKPHLDKECVITIDISKCFDNISVSRAAKVLQLELGISGLLATNFARLLCFRGVLAQGYATSNIVCNLVLRDELMKLDVEFSANNMTITNYVDDIAISGDIKHPDNVVNKTAVALSRCGLPINKSKVKVMYANGRQVICGLLVNKKLGITKLKQMELYAAVAARTIDEQSLKGWLANLRTINPTFTQKLRAFAVRKGYDLQGKSAKG